MANMPDEVFSFPQPFSNSSEVEEFLLANLQQNDIAFMYRPYHFAV